MQRNSIWSGWAGSSVGTSVYPFIPLACGCCGASRFLMLSEKCGWSPLLVTLRAFPLGPVPPQRQYNIVGDGRSMAHGKEPFLFLAQPVGLLLSTMMGLR